MNIHNFRYILRTNDKEKHLHVFIIIQNEINRAPKKGQHSDQVNTDTIYKLG